MASSQRPVWIVTGASSGIGQAIALQASRFATIIAVGRDSTRLETTVQAGCQSLVLDVTSSTKQINEAMTSIAQREGRIDVLVNAAGYLLEGSLEETDDQEFTHTFDTNVGGPLRLARAVLPIMRRARHGTIANIAGIGGLHGAPNAGVYCASKAAFSILTESLQAELAPLGVSVCLVQLGHFRSSFLQSGHRQKVQKHIPDYDAVLNPIRAAFNSLNGNQPGDPVKAARVIVEALTRSEVPLLLPVGSDVMEADARAYETRRSQMLDLKDVASSTDQ